MIVERLKHEETLHSFSDLMKIFVKMVVGERGVAGVLMVVRRGVQGGCGVFLQICNRTNSDCLPVIDSPLLGDGVL